MCNFTLHFEGPRNPRVKLKNFTNGSSKCKVKLRIFQISAFEIYVERLKESPTRSSKEVAQAVNQRGKSVSKVIFFSCTGRQRLVQVFGEEVHT